MLIAHLPSGHLIGTLGERLAPKSAPAVMAAALAGTVAPDLDMLWFHFVDSRTHHHALPTHWPLAWLAAGAVALFLARAAAPRWLPAVAAFFAAVMVHMVLDIVAAPTRWLAPFSAREFELVRVPAAHGHWIVSFVLHWTFLIELAICFAALALWLTRRRSARSAASEPRQRSNAA